MSRLFLFIEKFWAQKSAIEIRVLLRYLIAIIKSWDALRVYTLLI